LIGLLHEGHCAWRCSLKKWHPDLPHGSLSRTLYLNRAWERLIRLFAKHDVRPADYPARPD
jgi:hypothetical protein